MKDTKARAVIPENNFLGVGGSWELCTANTAAGERARVVSNRDLSRQDQHPLPCFSGSGRVLHEAGENLYFLPEIEP